MNKIISIIVPVYNVKKYLNRAISSILTQTYMDYEVILVDDGSDDGSEIICDQYSLKYNNIHVIHQKNKGPSEARNAGMLVAKGDYITFIDSDDYVKNNYLETLISLIVKHDADLACARFGFFSDDDITLNFKQKYKSNERKYTGQEACLSLMYEKNFYSSSCNLLVKRSIAMSNLFPGGMYHEDEMTTIRYLYSSKYVVMSNEVLYFYYQRTGSIMHRFGQPVYDEIQAADFYMDFFRDKNATFLKAATCKKFSLIDHVVSHYPELKEHDPDLYYKCVEFLRRKSLYVLVNRNSTGNNKKKAIKHLLNIYRR